MTYFRDLTHYEHAGELAGAHGWRDWGMTALAVKGRLRASTRGLTKLTLRPQRTGQPPLHGGLLRAVGGHGEEGHRLFVPLSTHSTYERPSPARPGSRS